MFKLWKKLLSEEDRKALNPFIIYTIVNTFLVYLAANDIGILNDYVAYGLVMSWGTYVLIFLLTTARY